MSRFTQAEKIKMLMAAFEFCPACQKQFLEYAAGAGTDPIKFMRELLWKLWGMWEHGEGCPQLVQPEAPARAAQVAPEERRLGPEAPSSVALPGSSGSTFGSNPEHVMGLERVAPEI